MTTSIFDIDLYFKVHRLCSLEGATQPSAESLCYRIAGENRKQCSNIESKKICYSFIINCIKQTLWEAAHYDVQCKKKKKKKVILSYTENESSD